MGYSIRKISLENGLPKSSVHAIIKRAQKTPDAPWHRNLRTGRRPMLDDRAQRRLVRFTAHHPFETIEMLSTPFKSGYKMSVNTTRSYLAKHEVYAFRPRRKPYLTPKHKETRLKWARIMVKWRDEDWACVIWSDESTFETGLHTIPAWCRRMKRHAFESRYLKPTFKSGRSSVGLWGCISLNFKGSM